MQENIIKVAVKGRTLTATSYIKPTRYSVDHDFVQFEFEENSEWAELTKFVTFYNDFVSVGQIPYAEKLKVPEEVLRYKSFRVTIEGSEGDTDRLLTATMGFPIHVDDSGKNDGDAPVSPSKTLLTQLREVADNVESVAADLEQKAASGYFKGADGESPSANVRRIDGGARITVTDRGGTTTAEVYDGTGGSGGASTWDEITGKPDFATVATSGSYDDLANKPTIPTVPTNVSAFNNDAGYLTDATATDVQINGTSITVDGVANIPYASHTKPGAVWSSSTTRGINLPADGNMSLASATNDDLKARTNGYKPIVSNNLDMAVKLALTDGKGAAYTDAEKKAARERIGLGDFELIEEITLTEKAHIIQRTADKNGKNYALTSLAIVLTAKNSADSTATYSFAEAFASNNTPVGGKMVNLSAGASTRYAIVVIENVHGLYFSHGYDNVNLTNWNASMAAPRLDYAAKEVGTVGNIQKLTLTMGGNSSNMFDVGTNVKIYGVWA